MPPYIPLIIDEKIMAYSDVRDLEWPNYEDLYLPKLVPFLRDAKQALQYIKDLQLGKDAIILATYPRSGTHWIWEITGMLLKGKAEYSKVSREQVFVEGLSDMSQMQSYNGVISTHVPFEWLPKQHVDNGGKIIYVVRNPKDTAVSIHSFLCSIGLIRSNTFEEFIHELYLGRKAMYGGWFEYNKSFIQEARRRDQILMLSYEKLKRNTEAEIRRLASFLGVKCTEGLITEISELTSFSKLQQADKSVREDKKMADIMKELQLNEAPTVYRKGEIGDWKNYFTVALNEEFDKAYAERMNDVDLQIEFE
ncbi:sulfotransferase 1E1-like [Saccostrea echinata]|uniref:sulfotransferase 1E1-like n=1 Tax=Saccostrea echinata TaxID=191078 RepID=UPI002A7F3809|nr:sulfotransferase 1E1-like [Saccostrea echinata]